MLLCVEEAMERGELGHILKAFNLPAYDAEIDYDQLYEHCLKIATQIESGMFAKFDCSIVSVFY